MPDDLLTPGDAAGMLGLSSTQGVAYLAKRGALTTRRTGGGHRRYLRAEVEGLARERAARQWRGRVLELYADGLRLAALGLDDDALIDLDRLPPGIDRKHVAVIGRSAFDAVAGLTAAQARHLAGVLSESAERLSQGKPDHLSAGPTQTLLNELGGHLPPVPSWGGDQGEQE